MRSFDLSKFPNLQEVEFGARYFGGHLLCVHRTLSTLGPATSPNLSAIRLEFLRSLPINFGPMPGETGDGFPRLADELVRIEREFGGAVNLAVVLDPMFAVAPGTRNVRVRSRPPRRGYYLEIVLISFTACRFFRVGARVPLNWSFGGVESFGRPYHRLAPSP